ncbi:MULTISPECIES: hypothetical protein [unclassified Serratia (in: enterobacteria)]|nr:MULTISPECIES: hypothetical protein [unclassified Serratia (in: enterobacteria)]
MLLAFRLGAVNQIRRNSPLTCYELAHYRTNNRDLRPQHMVA